MSVAYDLFLIGISAALSAALSWFITHKYYQKSLERQEAENSDERQKLIAALETHSTNDATLTRQRYIEEAVRAWEKQSTPEHYLKTLDIPDSEKAEIYRAACIRHRRREPKRNPYVQ